MNDGFNTEKDDSSVVYLMMNIRWLNDEERCNSNILSINVRIQIDKESESWYLSGMKNEISGNKNVSQEIKTMTVRI